LMDRQLPEHRLMPGLVQQSDKIVALLTQSLFVSTEVLMSKLDSSDSSNDECHSDVSCN